jgi:lipoprotein Spr
LKNLIPLIVLAILFASCNALKPAGKSSRSNGSGSSSQFLDDITVQSPALKSDQHKEENLPPIVDRHPSKMSINTSFNIESGTTVQFKYAVILDTEVEQLVNVELYRYIDEWWGTPYRMGGLTQRGIDCSAFVQSLFASVYGMVLPRVAKDQKKMCEKLDQNELEEGDLVFFNTRGGVSHVGVFLHNEKFVHTSTSNGVTISDLRDPYWNARYLGAGRPKLEAMAGTK